MQVLGECGNCGGSVVVPTVWHGIYPPKPSCTSCGSTPKSNNKPIQMNPKKG